MTDLTPSAVPTPANALDPAWVIDVRSISETGQNSRFMASPEQCAALARDLDILACNSLSVAYKLRSLHRGRYRLTGHINAELEQRCVVSLAPVPTTLADEFDIEFWPIDQLAAQPTPGVTSEASDDRNDSADFNVLGDELPEPIEHGRIAIGRIVFELVSAGLDPYPRQPGAAFAWSSTDSGPDNPFAALADFKAKSAAKPAPKPTGSQGD